MTNNDKDRVVHVLANDWHRLNAHANKILDPRRHAFDPGMGGVRCLRCGCRRWEHWGFLRRAVAWLLRGGK